MFDIGSSEFLVVILVALVVIGPKDLPKLLRFVGRWVGRARSVMSQFRAGIDEMVRQSEIDELEKKWRAENERIMREHPMTNDVMMEPIAKPAAATEGAADDNATLADDDVAGPADSAKENANGG